MPKTRLGLWSVESIIIFFFSLAVLLLFIAFGQRGGTTFFSNLALAIPGLLAGISGVFAFITGTIGIIKSKERSILTFIAVAVGFLVLIFCLGELLFPH